MISSARRLFVLAALAALLAACSSSPDRPDEPEEVTPPSKYTHAYIADISVSLTMASPDEATLADKQAFEEKIPALVKVAVEEEGLPLLAEDPGAHDGLIALKVNVSYDPGNRAARWIAGIVGAGKGRVLATIEGVDADTGAVIARRTEEDTKSMGLFGGDFYGMAESSVSNVATELAEVLLDVRE